MILEFKDLVKKYNMDIAGVIHIGAHYGEEVLNYVNAGIDDIVLFEPLESNFNILKNNISNINANINGYCVALGNKNENVNMFLSSNNLESSSVLKPKIHLDLHPDIVFFGQEEVEMKKLDDFFLTSYNFINIDVQGYELEVLKGGNNTLKYVDYVYCEVNRNEIYEGNVYIEELDEYLLKYKMKRVETSWWCDGDWGDALYIRNEL